MLNKRRFIFLCVISLLPPVRQLRTPRGNKKSDEKFCSEIPSLVSIENVLREIPTLGSIENVVCEIPTLGLIENVLREIPSLGSIENVERKIASFNFYAKSRR